MTKLTGKTVLITGSGGGIGSAIARACAAHGANVAMTDLDEDKLAAAQATLGDGARSLAFVADATDDAAMSRVARETALEFGSLDAVFANAGISAMAPLEEITIDIFQRVFTINTYSVLATIKAATPIMASQRSGGRIVNTCSVAGKTSFPRHTLYSATKYAIRSFTQGLAKELAGRNIAVNAICPGMIDTTLWDPIARRMADEGALEKPADVLAAFSGDVLLGRHGTPADLTGLAVFLASDEAAYINGQCINVDGGLIFD